MEKKDIKRAMSTIKIDILGTTAGIPTRHRAHSLVHLSYGGRGDAAILFDCGENAQRQIMIAGLNYMAVDHVFITHWHGDHSFGLPGLVDTMGFSGRQRPLAIYAPEKEMLDKNLEKSHSMADFPIERYVLPHKNDDPFVACENDHFRVLSVPAEHSVPAVSYAFEEKDRIKIDIQRALELGLPEQSPLYAELRQNGSILYQNRRIRLEEVSFMVRGRKVVYSGDTEVNHNLARLAEGADLLIQDCTYFDEPEEKKPYKHAALPDIIDMVKKVGVKKVLLTHISRKFDDPRMLRDKLPEGERFVIAADFMTLNV